MQMKKRLEYKERDGDGLKGQIFKVCRREKEVEKQKYKKKKKKKKPHTVAKQGDKRRSDGER